MSLDFWKRCLTHPTLFSRPISINSLQNTLYIAHYIQLKDLLYLKMISISFFCSGVFNSFFILKGSRWSVFTTELGHTPETKFFVDPSISDLLRFISLLPHTACSLSPLPGEISMLCISHITQFNSHLFFETVPQPHKHPLNAFIIL